MIVIGKLYYDCLVLLTESATFFCSFPASLNCGLLVNNNSIK